MKAVVFDLDGTLIDSAPDLHAAALAMLAEAAATACYHVLEEADIARWQPGAPPALIFSNAALQWVPDHATLLPRLAAMLAPGGVLAVQVPDQQDAPSHRLLREVSAALFPDRFDWTGFYRVVAPELLKIGP